MHVVSLSLFIHCVYLGVCVCVCVVYAGSISNINHTIFFIFNLHVLELICWADCFFLVFGSTLWMWWEGSNANQKHYQKSLHCMKSSSSFPMRNGSNWWKLKAWKTQSNHGIMKVEKCYDVNVKKKLAVRQWKWFNSQQL